MKKLFLLSVALFLNGFIQLNAQQTPVFSEYDSNTVLINPAHSGFYAETEIVAANNGYLNNIDGGPQNFAITLNLPLQDQKMGLGIGTTNDKVGVTDASSFFVSYAYKIKFATNYRRAVWWELNPEVLSFGVTAGVVSYNEDLLSLGLRDDPNFAQNTNVNQPTFGVGALFNTNTFYVGVSALNLFTNSISNIENNLNLDTPVYAYAGYRIFATKFEEILIKPNALIKYVKGAPTQIDLNTTVNYKNKFEVGGGYRSNSSINLLAGFYFKNFRFRYNYNMSFLESPIPNTHGFIVSARFGGGFKS